MIKYDVVWGGDPGEAGVWNDATNEQSIGAWALEKYFKLDPATVAGWSQRQLAGLVRRYEEVKERV